MKLICLILFTCFLQSVHIPSLSKPVRLEDNSIYFKKGEYKEFFNNKLARIREIQLEYPEIVLGFSLFQLKSEPRSLSAKRQKQLLKSFREADLDMDRILFDPDTHYEGDFKKHNLSLDPGALDSVGAILEGTIKSLF